MQLASSTRLVIIPHGGGPMFTAFLNRDNILRNVPFAGTYSSWSLEDPDETTCVEFMDEIKPYGMTIVLRCYPDDIVRVFRRGDVGIVLEMNAV